MPDAELPVFACACASVRRASRALTQLYENALRPAALTVPQHTILRVLSSVSDRMTVGALAHVLASDSTTLTRNLARMEEQGWVVSTSGEDRRARLLRITPAGKAILKRASRHWDSVQAQLRDRLGEQRWTELLEANAHLATVALELI
jgi:DNA-binding MarR family transcriptional regulator